MLTTLTERVFISHTQALRHAMGGACAGKEGVGKTATVTELGTALGQWVVCLNCSNLLEPRTSAALLRGLAMSGAWGCLDEFDRIGPGMLSLFAGQLSVVLSAVRARIDWFDFEAENLPLRHGVGVFVTFSAGKYQGRHRLPHSLVALLRPCAMTAPDLQVLATGSPMTRLKKPLQASH